MGSGSGTLQTPREKGLRAWVMSIVIMLALTAAVVAVVGATDRVGSSPMDSDEVIQTLISPVPVAGGPLPHRSTVGTRGFHPSRVLHVHGPNQMPKR